MIESYLIDYLQQEVRIPVYAEQPEQKPALFIVLTRLGGSVRDRIPWIAVAVQSYANTLFGASSLMARACTSMGRLEEQALICGCRLNSCAAFNNPDTHQYRYQATYEINYYEEDLQNGE